MGLVNEVKDNIDINRVYILDISGSQKFDKAALELFSISNLSICFILVAIRIFILWSFSNWVRYGQVRKLLLMIKWFIVDFLGTKISLKSKRSIY